MELQIFNNPQFGDIRTAVTEKGEPFFCLVDLCRVLSLSNPTMVASRIDDDFKAKFDLGLKNGQDVTFVNESGMYSVILRSDSTIAKPIQKWVTSEVLPSIRKNGMYATDITIDKMISDPDFAIKLLTNLKEEKEKRILAEKKAKEQEPKVLFANAVATSERSILIHELAKLLKQNGIEIGGNRLFDWLRKNGYLCNRGDAYNIPTQHAMELHLFELKKTTINKPDGSILVSTTPKVTGKGQIYFVNKFLKASSSIS